MNCGYGAISEYKKVGIVLLIVGGSDIAYLIYALFHKMDYSSSISIFAVIAGIFLLRGSVRTASILRWFSAFFLTTIAGSSIIYPIVEPPGLFVTRLKLDTGTLLLSFILLFLFAALLYWVYRQLNKPASLAALSSVGFNTGKPKFAFITGVLLIVALTAILLSLLNGESANKAKSLAKEQLGAEFEYHVSSMQISGSGGRATVTAYNNEQIKTIDVSW